MGTFAVCLGTVRTPDAAETTAPPVSRYQLGATVMACILVIDDDPNVRRVLEMMLERAGYEVMSAADGCEGMRLFHEHVFDLVITDVIMPRQEGLETISELRRQKRRVPVVAITGYIGKPYLEAAAQLGACEVLFKPFGRRQLIEAVARALAAGAAGPGTGRESGDA